MKRKCKRFKQTKAGRRCASYGGTLRGGYRGDNATTALDEFLRELRQDSRIYGGVVGVMARGLGEWIQTMREGAPDDEVVEYMLADLDTLEGFAKAWKKSLKEFK
jgi:hypothetical protein